LQIEGSDPDPGDNLRYRANGLPAGLSINPATGDISGEVGFETAASSPHVVSVTVSDDGQPVKSASTSFEWIVDNTNRPPTAAPMSVVVLVGEPAQIVLDAVDPDGDELALTVTEPPALGSLEGEFPDLEYLTIGGSSDQFTYTVSDGEFEVEGLVAIEIRTSNGPPVAETDEYAVDTDAEITVAAPGVLGNDGDPDGEQLTAVLIARPDHGELTLNPDGSFTYTPEARYVGGDKFTYAAVDALGEQSLATVVLTVGDQEVTVAAAIDNGTRTDVLAATVASWQPPVADESSVTSQIRRAVVSSVNAGISSVPDLGYPLLLLAIALLVVVTLGRISLLPFAAGKTQEVGLVRAYDETYGFGRLVPDEGDEVFVHGRALDAVETLAAGQRVEFIAATIKGRRIALKVWAAT
jgi:cold shock CspA family protein